MDRTDFLEILRRFANTSVDEAQAIASLKAEYPYSQLIQILSARASKDHGLQHQQRDLQVAAVYSADRALLKEIITREPAESIQQVVSKHIDAEKQVASTLESVDVADTVMDDLDRLSKLKDTFENLFMDYPQGVKPGNHGISTETEEAEEKATEEQPVTSITFKAADESELSPVKAKKQRIIEMAKTLTKQTDDDSDDAVSKKKPRENPDELIAEIQNSKEEISPENERQKQQIEIINQFIRVQPSISNPRERVPSTGDFNTIKSGEFGENIVSETLVEILVKQGKKDRAVEVLKKLIWKYPQKKAYFASRIEELKK